MSVAKKNVKFVLSISRNMFSIFVLLWAFVCLEINGMQ